MSKDQGQDAKPPCRGADGLSSCHTAAEFRFFCPPGVFVPEAAETCPICGHIRARRR